jgi:hypothetical protein
MFNIIIKKRIHVIISLILNSILEIIESLNERDEIDTTMWMRRIMKQLPP